MDWKRAAIEDLRTYNKRKQSLENIREKIRSLDDQFKSIKMSSADITPIQGGGNKTEDNWINNITQRQRLQYTYAAAKRLVDLVEKGLSGLSDQQRTILTTFYIDRPQGHIDLLMERLHVEQAQIYRMKDDALYQFTVSMYGLIDY